MPTMLASVPQNALPTTACGPVLVRERDMRRLSTLLETSLNCRYPKESARLSEVLRAAIVVADDAIAVGTVTMGAQVFCEDQDGLRSWDERPASFDDDDDERLPPSDVPLESSPRLVGRDSSHGHRRELTLVYPWDEDRFHGQISILSPLGVALLGLRAGETAAWRDESGAFRRVRVLDVTPARRAA